MHIMTISDTLKIYFVDMKDSELKKLYKEVAEKRKSGQRPESLVLLAKHVQKNIGGDYTLAEALDELMDALLLVVADRYFAMDESNGRISMGVSYDTKTNELEVSGSYSQITRNKHNAADYVKDRFMSAYARYTTSKAIADALKQKG